MKIKRIRVTIEPYVFGDSIVHLRDRQMELRVEVLADGQVFTVAIPYAENHFESVFGFLMKEAQERIEKMATSAQA